MNIQPWRAMGKAYPSNLIRDPYEFFKDLLLEAKSGGLPRRVDLCDLWKVLNAIFYLLVEGVRWRSLPGDFPAIALRTFKKGRRCTTIFASGAGTGL